MRLVQFKIKDGLTKIGAIVGKNVVDLNATDCSLPNSIVELLSKENVLKTLETKVSNAAENKYPLSQVQLLPPITKPDKILGIAGNYKDFCDKTNMPYPPEPVAFSKFPSRLVGPYDALNISENSDAVDWEVELVVVIGKQGKNISAKNAYDHIFGYTACQDLTEKKWIKRNGGQFLMCKNFDDFLPLGPCLVTKDEIKNPENLSLKTWVNGELKQDGNTCNLIHKIDSLVEYFSSIMTLLPGDIILTGTPYGVGSHQNPPQFLKKGDKLESMVEDIGKLENKIL